MTQKFGHESKKFYLKVYCNLIDIKMFTFAQIFKKMYGFYGVLARLTEKIFFFINGFLKIFRIKRCITLCAFINISYYSASTKSFRDTEIWRKMP